nr:serine hydrolase domain-containing protein [Pontibacter sp. FD36]
MDRNADSLLLDSKINSVSIGIYKDGKKYTSHYGELDKGKGNRPSDSTIYEIASVSKTFTGILVANAVLDKKISLEDDIRDYLNEDFPNFEYQNEPIKIKHLLTHTSRLPRFLPDSISELLSDFNESLPFRFYEMQKGYSKKDFFKDLHNVKLDTVPGAKYQYSNVGTELMAKILENVYQKTFDEILRVYFEKAADMGDTQISLPKDKETNLANGYGMANNLVPHEVVMFGAAGGVKTTMPDLVSYMALQLDTNNSTVAESHRALYVRGSREMVYYWPVRNSEEYGKYFSIHGGAFGSQNWFFILPKYNLGISVITNQSDLETADKLMKTVKGLIEDLK